MLALRCESYCLKKKSKTKQNKTKLTSLIRSVGDQCSASIDKSASKRSLALDPLVARQLQLRCAVDERQVRDLRALPFAEVKEIVRVQLTNSVVCRKKQ